MYLLRTNLAIAVVEMTTDKNITDGNKTYIQVRDHKSYLSDKHSGDRVNDYKS